MTLLERLSKDAMGVVERSKLSASFVILFEKTAEVYFLVRRYKRLYNMESRSLGGILSKVVYVDNEVFEKDVADGAAAEILASRFLFSPTHISGGDYLARLGQAYRRRVVVEHVRDLISEHRLASLQLRIHPEYFPLERARRISAIFPQMKADFAEFYRGEGISRVTSDFIPACEELVDEGFLVKFGGYYRVSEKAFRRYMDIQPPSGFRLGQQLREYLTQPMLAKVILQFLVGAAASSATSPQTQVPEPDSYIAIDTALGPQPLTIQLGVEELVKALYGDKPFKIRRRGGLLNATYLLSIGADGGERLFVKKFLNWTDLKWVAARIWTAWVKDFKLNPSTRLATEIFYLDQLRNMGFNTPEVVHVNWREKTLFTTFIDGENLLEMWIRNTDGKEDAANRVGLLLAEIHSKDITLGDCKPESFILSGDKIYVTDLEQAGYSKNRSWDLMELIFYPGHYLEAEDAAGMARNIVEGYLRAGDVDVVRGALSPKYLRILSLWTPFWVQKTISEAVKEVLES